LSNLIINKPIQKVLIFAYIVLLLSSCARNNLEQSYTYSTQDEAPANMINTKSVRLATMRPYEVFGKTYYPKLVSIDDSFNGVASWYGPNFHNKKTSNGEIYNMHALTAASKTLPMNTMVEVLNKENGKKVIVRINDRGPFVKSRIIDLSNKAARTIDMTKKGTARVRLKVVGFNGQVAKTKWQKQQQMSFGECYVQVGAFSHKKGAYTLAKKFNLILTNQKAMIKKKRVKGKLFYVVRIGYFKSEDEGLDFIANNKLKGSFLVAK